MAGSWREFTSLIRSLVRPYQKTKTRRRVQQKIDCKREDFHLDPLPGGSTLFGRFLIGDRFVLVYHRQWEGDSHPMTLQQRKEILRRTLAERLKKELVLQ